MLAKLIVAGVNIFRLNMSHGTHDWVRKVVKDIRVAAAANQKHVGILMDTQGPAIRTGDLSIPINLKPGGKFTFTVRGERSEEEWLKRFIEEFDAEELPGDGAPAEGGNSPIAQGAQDGAEALTSEEKGA